MRERCVGEEAAHIGVRAPQVVADHLAAAQVLDLKAKVPVTLVRLKHRRIRVLTKVLPGKKVLISFVY